MVDFIKCLACTSEKQKKLTFRSISLPVRSVHSEEVIYGSVVSFFLVQFARIAIMHFADTTGLNRTCYFWQ